MLNDSLNATPPVSRIYLVDGTYELFRSYFGAPKATTAAGPEVGATRGILRSLFALVREPAVTHIACAFDHVIESFRNDLFDGYKTSAGVPDDLMAQFPLAERAAHALGIVVWPMVEFEADDAIAAAAERWRDAPGVEQIVICTPDKDMAQCVRDNKVVCLDRRQRRVIDAAGVIEKFGVPPASIPDWLALVGDAADGYPGVPRWGGKSAAGVAGALRAHRIDPGSRVGMASQCAGRCGAGSQPSRASGRGVSVSATGHAESGRAAQRATRRTSLARSQARRIDYALSRDRRRGICRTRVDVA